MTRQKGGVVFDTAGEGGAGLPPRDTHLELARSLVAMLVPSAAQVAAMAAASGLRIDAVHRPKEDLGGDLWAMRQLPDGRVLFLLADAVGHGLSGAINALRVDAVLRGVRRAAPGALVRDLDRRLARIDHGRLTAAIGVLAFQPRRATAVLSCAGLPPAFLLREGRVRMLESRGLPAGSGLAAPRSLRFALRPGDRVLLATDGFQRGDPAAMQAVLAALPDLSAAGLSAARLAALAGGMADDLTLLLLTRSDP
mgnify:CR=1 FL=1